MIRPIAMGFLAPAILFGAALPLLAAPLELTVRKAEKPRQPGPAATVTIEQVDWPPDKTAIIIIDMWDKHHCRSAEARVAEMAAAMNRAVAAARGRGVLVIHSPSDCMEFYADTPQRRRAVETPPAKAPASFQWNNLDPKHEGRLADEVATAGCSCDTAEPCGPDYRAWKRQIETIEIAADDAVSDNGQEIYNLLRQRGIEHVIVMGVHTNVCVLGRPFGIRQLVYLGLDVVLCRDLTDSYHRRVAASHFDGLNMIVRHIEQYWCPTITSESLTGQPPFRFAGATRSGVELAVLSPDTWDEFAPRGKEADCIYGDVVLRNERITAVIAQPVEGRHANMTVRNVGGAIIDLTNTLEPNDQLSAYYPGGPGLNWRSLTIDAGSGQKTLAEVEKAGAPLRADEVRVTCRAEAADSQPSAEVTYVLTHGADWLRVESVFTGGGDKDREMVLKDEMRADATFEKSGSEPGRLFWAYDKWFGQAYGIVADGRDLRCQSNANNSIIHYLHEGAERVTLAPGQTAQLTRQLAPAPHLLSLKTQAGMLLAAEQEMLRLEVRDSNGQPLPAADVVVLQEETVYGSGRTDREGAIEFALPAGEFKAVVSSLGGGSQTLKLAAGENHAELPAAGGVAADIRDADERPIACKVQFRGRDGTKDPDFGHQTGEWAVRNAYYSEHGQFRQPLPAGKYQVIVSHGPEYDAVVTEIEIIQGRETPLVARLTRSVHTPGWISADFHNHASPSGDNTSSQLGRVLNLLAEHIEFAPCTEHNRLSSYEPHLVRLRATEQMGSCVGIELTDSPFSVNHHNAFPLAARPHTQDNGGPLPDHDMELKIERLAMWDGGSDKLVQQNHPDIGTLFFDKDGDGQPDSGFRKAFGFIDVIEVHPPAWIFQPPLITSPGRKPQNNTVFNWLQLLNQGLRIPGVVNTDAHYNFHGSGFLRIYVQSPTDDPAEIQTLDIVHACEHGRIIMTNGPYLEVSLSGAGDKATAGGDAEAADGKATLAVRVQCPNWFDVDRVQIYLNGSPRPELNFTRVTTPDRFGDGTVKFDQQIALELTEDTHVIVVAAGQEKTLGDVMGPDHAADMPIAISNPIFIDVDGGGFKANGDTLGAPLPVTPGK